MGNVKGKKCVRPQCGTTYSITPVRKYCDCGALLVDSDTAPEKKVVPINKPENRPQKPRTNKKAQLVLLLDDDQEIAFELKQSNTIGMSTDKGPVDIDLTQYTQREFISRRHAQIYLKDNTYYITKITKKHSVHVNEKAVSDAPIKLISGDMVLLSKKLVFQFEEV
ncbi:FHA domain-containing protein [Butyrivibrio sp. VCB2001]|uniref:FHA domain-containing protein n=1 Tax=Butyrivibrio sp. VCB2001 TaxID=1280667 RepID=UPI00047CBFD5|nr:FHA domain-containing protein [Butyrivibrio sp. VCB2001]